jgi:hypothetical protein
VSVWVAVAWGAPVDRATVLSPPADARPVIDTDVPGMLTRQAQALVSGHQKGWLASVDFSDEPLLDRYRTLYANLRGLHVSA